MQKDKVSDSKKNIIFGFAFIPDRKKYLPLVINLTFHIRATKYHRSPSLKPDTEARLSPCILCT